MELHRTLTDDSLAAICNELSGVLEGESAEDVGAAVDDGSAYLLAALRKEDRRYAESAQLAMLPPVVRKRLRRQR